MPHSTQENLSLEGNTCI